MPVRKGTNPAWYFTQLPSNGVCAANSALRSKGDRDSVPRRNCRTSHRLYAVRRAGSGGTEQRPYNIAR